MPRPKGPGEPGTLSAYPGWPRVVFASGLAGRRLLFENHCRLAVLPRLIAIDISDFLGAVPDDGRVSRLGLNAEHF